MKKIVYGFFILLMVTFYSCDNSNEKFSGSPVDNLTIETIEGIVSTDVENNFALPGQEINFTVTLPDSFRAKVHDSVTVEATTLTVTGSKRTASLILGEDQLTATGKILVGGSSVFDSSFKLYLSAIHVNNNDSGVHYLLNSNTIDLLSSNSSVPDLFDDRLQVKIAWENNSKKNTVRCYVKNSSNQQYTIANGDYPKDFKSYYISNSQRINTVNGTAIPTGTRYQYLPSEYTFSIGAISVNDLETNPIDLKYKITFVYPNGNIKIFSGTYFNMSNTSGKLDIAKVTKTGIDESSDYSDVINLNP
jgi:hypothetical protein